MMDQNAQRSPQERRNAEAEAVRHWEARRLEVKGQKVAGLARQLKNAPPWTDEWLQLDKIGQLVVTLSAQMIEKYYKT
jgi:hypothetical protein